MTSQLAPVTLGSLQQPVRQELDSVFDELVRIIHADFSLISDVNAHLLRMRGKIGRAHV